MLETLIEAVQFSNIDWQTGRRKPVRFFNKVCFPDGYFQAFFTKRDRRLFVYLCVRNGQVIYKAHL